MSSRRLTEAIRQQALSLGFSACGFARADRVSPEMEERLRHWLSTGGNADMAYMANWTDKRLDPRLLMPGLKTIVSVALNYAPAHRLPEGEPQISAYALGHDYHDVVKKKLRQLASGLSAEYRIFCDTGPVLERYWAVQAGLGWIGKNHQLIIPFAGSMFFLGELFLDIELDYDQPMKSRCGNCHKCIDACPTHALGASVENKYVAGSEDESNHNSQFSILNSQTFSTSLCLSYQTIENRGELSETAKENMGDTFYGCDRCQAACPWNKFAKPNDTPELQPGEELLSMTREKWHSLTVDDYRRLFKGSAVKRAKYEGLMRNIRNLK